MALGIGAKQSLQALNWAWVSIQWLNPFPGTVFWSIPVKVSVVILTDRETITSSLTPVHWLVAPTQIPHYQDEEYISGEKIVQAIGNIAETCGHNATKRWANHRVLT